MTIKRTPAVLTFIFGSLVSLRAQQSAIQQLQNTQQAQQQQNLFPALVVGTNAPELYQGENVDVGPQRILRLNPRPSYFDVLFDSQVFYTENANFAAAPGMIDSSVFVNTAQAAFTPPAWDLGSGKFSTDLGIASQWYNYGNNHLTSLDFDAQTVFADGRYSIGHWQFSVGANYTRLVNQSDYSHETYREFLPNLAVQRVFAINDQMLFAVGDQLDYHFTKVPLEPGSSTGINDRLDDTIYFTFSWQLTRSFVVQPFYRFQYSHYQYDVLMNGDRNEFLHTFGVTLIYSINRNISLRTFLNYSRKQTDDPYTPEYHEYDGGLGAALDIKF
jgi:hypothetical protein